MALSRKNEPNIPVVIMLYKDIWMSHILPKLESRDLMRLSQASKQARQAAFVELLKRPLFKANMDSKITRHSSLGKSSFFNEKAWFGDTSLTAAIRGVQFALLVTAALLLEIAYHTYQDGYPTPEAVTAALKAWKDSPGYGSEFDTPPTILLMNRFPDDNYQTLSLLMITAVILSFICRSVFKCTNHKAITNAHREQKEQADHRHKAERLRYLRDRLPRETIVSHTLFVKVTSSGSKEALRTRYFYFL